MNSPFTGGNVTLRQKQSELLFRKEKFQYLKLYYECEDTRETFTTTELDELNIGQVYNQYRVKYGIPFPDEIGAVRTKYGLSASKMSEILGFGDNQYRLYENGEMPSETNGKVLHSIMNPTIFEAFVDNAEYQFSPKEFLKIKENLEKVIRRDPTNELECFVFDGYSRSINNGYAKQSYSKLKNILLFYIDRCNDAFNTKMNKLLFYTDFLSYKSFGTGMSGLAYKAIQYGPVPSKWDRVYGMMDDIYPEIIEFSSGNSGTKLCSSLKPDMSKFTENELAVLNAVIDRFKDVNSNEISKISHEEDAWIKFNETNAFLDFSEAFTLKAVSLD